MQAPCGALFAYLFASNKTGVFSLNTTSTSVSLPTIKGVQYRAAVSASCLPTDGCSPATVYGQFVPAYPLVFTAGVASATPSPTPRASSSGGGGLPAGAKAGVAIVRGVALVVG